jgi:FtsH-binding integral membrane protein
MKLPMTNSVAQQETGASLMFIGLAIWIADLLVAFFLPAGARRGSRPTFISIITFLAALGLGLTLTGYFTRRKSVEQ